MNTGSWIRFKTKHNIGIAVTILLVLQSFQLLAEEPLSLTMAVQSAQANDPWLLGNQHSQDSLESLSIASGSLPDPKISIGFANLPTDTFNFDQERMTQFKIGVSQMFPRGNSLDLRRKQFELLASQHPFQRQNRKANVVVTVAHLWLDAFKAQESIALIEQDRALFEQLADVAEASYSSAMGKTRQQDIVRAQLELTRLNDRLTVLHQHREVALRRLTEWRSVYFLPQTSDDQSDSPLNLIRTLATPNVILDHHLPEIRLLNPELYISATETQPQKLYQYLADHAVVQGLEQRIKAHRTGIELAQQKYRPEWGVNASYGYRNEDATGLDRADLFSVGISFDLPLFTANRQDKELQSAVRQKTDLV